MIKCYNAYYESPIGIMKISASSLGIVESEFVDNFNQEDLKHLNCLKIRNDKNIDLTSYRFLRNCINQLDEYFKGERKNFSIELHTIGTEFRKKVWRELIKIPYGNTCSYTDIAEAIGNKKAVRAVGGANNCNNIAVIIPCHRVVGKNGDMKGYAWGLWRKKWLLQHENMFKNRV